VAGSVGSGSRRCGRLGLGNREGVRSGLLAYGCLGCPLGKGGVGVFGTGGSGRWGLRACSHRDGGGRGGHGCVLGGAGGRAERV